MIGIVTASAFLDQVTDAPREHAKSAHLAALQIMSAPVVTVRDDESAAGLSALVEKHRFHHVAVVSRDGRYAGMVTRYGVPTRLAATVK